MKTTVTTKTSATMKTTLVILIASAAFLLNACDSTPPPPTPEQIRQEALVCAEPKAVLVENTGTYSRKINTDSNDAQVFFDQGLRLTYSYYFPEALASFDAALCFDPDNAMIHWGRALAIAPNPNSRYGGVEDDPVGAGWEAIQRAQELATLNSESDINKNIIKVTAMMFDKTTHPDQVARSAAFINSTQELYQQYPQDLEVAFLAADAIMMATPWQYFTAEGSAINLADKAQAILEAGIASNTQHPGLNHLHIHLMENSPWPEKAEASADRLESLTPKAGHMVHMPGHIFMRLGRYADSIATNQRSLEADHYFKSVWGDRVFPTGVTYGLSHRGHAGHAQNFIHWGATLQGNSQLALATIKEMVDALPPQRSQSGSGQRALANYWMTLRFFHKWEDILALELPNEAPPYIKGIWHFVRGSANIETGEITSAQVELEQLVVHSQNQVLQNQRVAVNRASNLLEIATAVLQGEIALANGAEDEAIELFKVAVAKQDLLRYMEPPDWLQSTRLNLGNAYLDLERYADAEKIFREDLELLRENGWALYGLLQSLLAQEQEDEIIVVEERFGKAWQYADTDLGSY